MPAAPFQPTSAEPSGSTSALRIANQRRVLDLLRERQQGYSQAEVARITGLAPATVSNIVRALADAGLADVEVGAGRRGSTVMLDHRAGIVAGVDIAHDILRVAVGTLHGNILEQRSVTLTDEDDCDSVLGQARDILAAITPADRSILRGTISIAAPLVNGVATISGLIPTWIGLDIASYAGKILEIPVTAYNNAHLAALAEHHRGAAVGTMHSVRIEAGRTLDLGIVVNGELFTGASGSAGDFGHNIFMPVGRQCRCGNRGCTEIHASTDVLIAQSEPHLGTTTMAALVAEAHRGQPLARRVIEEAGYTVGSGLAVVTNLLNPQIITVGGDLATAGEMLVDVIKMGMRARAIPELVDTPIKLSTLGDSAALSGAIISAANAAEIPLA